MTITLVLVRHAKSDWGQPGLDDHDRPLNDRGFADAPRMAAQLAGSGIRLDTILASTALRARTTAGFFGEALGLEIDLRPELYGASGHDLLQAASGSGSNAVMVVAHDPGMTILASNLSGGRIEHMPTCAVATFEWADDDWDLVGSVEPTTWSYETPR